MNKQRLERFIEFLFVGVIMGVTEDLIAVMLATDAEFNFRILYVIIIVSIPFAIFSELIVDKKSVKFIEKIAEKLEKF